MNRILRRLWILVPVALALGAHALPGRAQQGATSRYAFADTTLLRDTLDLHFDRLFPAADSLGLLPDTLRALMIRYRFPLERLIFMADSMAVPVDSVGPIVDRERFNPLAAGRAHGANENVFRFTSGWNTAQRNSSWSNTSEYRVRRGAFYANNLTNVNLERYKNVAATTLRQTRDMTSEAGARLTENQSFGLWAHTNLFDSFDPKSTTNAQETLNELKLSARSQRRGARGSSADLNLLAGYLHDDNRSVQIKRGLSGRADGRVRTVFGSWLTNDLTAGTDANVARTRRPDALDELRALDLSTNLAGTLTLFSQRAVGLNLNYNLRRTRVDTPTDSGTVNTIRQSGEGVVGTLRIRRDNERQINVTGNGGSGRTRNGLSRDTGGKANLRWVLSGWATDANYSDGRRTTDYPRQAGAYGYIERSVSRSADTQFQRALGRRLQTKLSASISLSRFRYEATADSARPPTPRDSYRQSFRADTRYNPTPRLTSGAALEVTLSRTINIERTTTASNNDTRSYRGEWTWSYQMLKGLTVTQNNQITADYRFYPFAPVRNTLGLTYSTITSLNTVLTPRLSMRIAHSIQEQPQGSYTRDGVGPESLKLSDSSRNLRLRATIQYAPLRAVTFTLEPDYLSNVRSGTTNGVSVKQRDDRKLNLNGGVTLNLQIGQKGTLSGNISRAYTDSRSIGFENGAPVPSPSSAQDFWNGSMTLTWEL